MKKILLLLVFSLGMNAQSLLSENFDALGSPLVLPSGWSQLNLSSPIGTVGWFRGNPASFPANTGPTDGYIGANFNSGAGTATLNNWLFTPTVSVQNGDEVSFFTRTGTGQYPDRLELRMSTAGTVSNPTSSSQGSFTTLCLSVNPNLVVGATGGYPVVWTKQTYVVTGLTGQVNATFALRYNVTTGGPNGANSDYIGVDDFIIRRPGGNDLALESVTIPAIITVGNYSFNGIVRNQGTNAITSYSVTWRANNGVINTFNVTGVNIAPGTTHNFTHSVPLNAVVGQSYALVFNVSTVNGGVDGDTSNNSLNASTQVASGSTTFMPIIEKFTSSTCAPCASYNNATFNPFFDATYSGNTYNYIAYQQNFPGAGDPYFTQEALTRRNYYSISSITSLRINGANYGTGNNQAALTSFMTSEGAKTGYFTVTGSRSLTTSTATVNYNVIPNLSGTYVMYAAVYEKLTTGNFSTNGESSFKHVMMKMIPNASGTTLTCVAGTPIPGQITTSLTGTFIEDIADLEVIIFIQNPTTKEIMQSFKVTAPLSVNTNALNEVKLYPNPAKDFIKISNIESADIAITDITGKIVVTAKNVTDASNISVAALTNGIYFVTVKNEKINQTIKFLKK